MSIIVLQHLLFEAFVDIFYFPVWWYTRGAKHAAMWSLQFLRGANEWLLPGLWLKNIFVPMFGQRDVQGKLISFFMRLVNVVFRGIALLVMTAVALALFLVWLIFPLLVISGIVLSVGKITS